MTRTPERFFHHSFPRPRGSVESQLSKGIQILRSMCRNGMLLVPERVSWTDPSGRPGDKVFAMQRRSCFTELSSSELPTRAETFGPFALEFRIADLRRVGLLPVIYLPDSSTPDPALDWAGVSLLARLADAQRVIAALAETRELPGPTFTVNLTNRDGFAQSRIAPMT